MLIGICGPICAGKATVADYLIKKHNFTPLTIKRDDETPTIEKSANFAHWTSAALEFPTALLLDQYVSENWRENYVLTTIWNEAILDTLAKRPHFILLSIDAPISVRWQRFRERCAQENQEAPALDDFVLRNDEHLYNPLSSLAALSSRAQIRILNPTTTITQLRASLDALNLLDPARMRPTWDHCPCLTCSVKIVQVGITEVVFSQSYHMDTQSAKIFQEAGVHLRQYAPPREGLVNLCDLGIADSDRA
ncbi:hypothetical protein VTO58DRAFT_104022 [Aureobasidium pullulans]